MKNNKFIIYLFVVVTGVIVIDVIFRLVFTPLFDNPPLNTKASSTYKFVAHKTPADLVILGASRAQHHYISEQMEDSLGVSVYNYGSDGRCTLYQYLCLLNAIENGEVKIAILDLSSAQLSKEWVDDRISDLYPYYWKNDTVRQMVDEVEKKDMSCLMLSAMVQFNSQYLNLIAPMNSNKGYIPLPYTGIPLDTSNMKMSEDIKQNDYYSDIASRYFSKIVSLCRDKNVQLLVCLSPSLSFSKSGEDYMQKLCINEGVVCWNLTRFIQDPVLFSDNSHLNDKGAELFTNEIIRLLIQSNFIK